MIENLRLVAALALVGALMGAAGAASGRAGSVTPATALAAASPSDWAAIDPNDLLLIDLAGGGRVAIAVAPGFAPVHVANIRTLARAAYYDGLAIDRVQDNYVTQWGDVDAKKPLPRGIVRPAPPEYERAAAGLAIVPMPYRDTFAARTGAVGPFPVAAAGPRAWLAHCYGMVGVGRDLNPDTGTGAELYAVIGHAPRQLDRNIALVGRVVDGMALLAALPRGAGEMGFYADAAQRTAIVRAYIAADLPSGARPAFEYLRPGSPGFAAWRHARANRHDDFYLRPAGAIDLCGALPPVRAARLKRGR